jgi:hypothetical protein
MFFKSCMRRLASAAPFMGKLAGVAGVVAEVNDFGVFASFAYGSLATAELFFRPLAGAMAVVTVASIFAEPDKDKQLARAQAVAPAVLANVAIWGGWVFTGPAVAGLFSVAIGLAAYNVAVEAAHNYNNGKPNNYLELTVQQVKFGSILTTVNAQGTGEVFKLVDKGLPAVHMAASVTAAACSFFNVGNGLRKLFCSSSPAPTSAQSLSEGQTSIQVPYDLMTDEEVERADMRL